jgi:hypothetical protein
MNVQLQQRFESGAGERARIPAFLVLHTGRYATAVRSLSARTVVVPAV